MRERAVRLVLDNQRRQESRWSALLWISSKTGCSPQTHYEWVKKAEVDRGERTGIASEKAETINGLFKAEVMHHRGPWRGFDAVEYASL